MVSDALQDEDWDTLKENLFSISEDISIEHGIDLFEDYIKKVDINLVERGMAFKPAKSIEFGKTDQSMLNHIRNGILFLLRFNSALEKLGIKSLDDNSIRKCIALFVVHDLHKLEFNEFMDEELAEKTQSIETEFEIPKEVVKKFVSIAGLDDFAPGLVDDDYFSVAVALHKSRFSRSGARTSLFMDMEPFLYLMDTMSSCASPEDAASSRSLTALRDGFPQSSVDAQLNLQYHRLDDMKGIFSGLINKSVADVLEKNGLIMLMAYQDGCVYLGHGAENLQISDSLIEDIYANLKSNIQDSTPAFNSADSLITKMSTPRLGYYDLGDEYYFFSGPENVLRAFISGSITSAYTQKSKKISDSMVAGINRAEKAVPIDLEKETEGQRILIGFSRAIATVHNKFISEMISDNKQALSKTCEIWNVPLPVKDALLKEIDDKEHELAKGGKWEYSHAIAQCVMDQDIDGVKLRNIDVPTITNILIDNIWNELTNMEQWDDFLSNKTATFYEELTEYLHEILSINGTISFKEDSSLSDTFQEHAKNGRICNLCNRGTLLNKNQMKTKSDTSFLSYNFSNRVFVGKSKPDNIFTCIPCSIELTLRRNGFNLPKGSASNHELLYFHFVPDYFFTMESWEMINTIMGKFSDEARIRMSALASKIFNSKYIDGAPEIEGDVDVYDSWINDMTAKLEDEGSSGMDMAQYMAQGYDNIIGNTSIVFYKPSTSVTEFHFFGVYIATLIAAYTGMRVVVSQSPIPSIRGRDFKEMVALDSINSHVTDFYGKFCPLSSLEDTLRSTSALINLFYASSGLKDSLLPKFLRIIRNEPLPGSYMLKMLYRNSDSGYAEINVNKFLDSAQFLDYATQR